MLYATSYLSLVIVLYVLLPALVHRSVFDEAFIAWRMNPTAGNEALLHVQQRKTFLLQLEEASAAGPGPLDSRLRMLWN